MSRKTISRFDRTCGTFPLLTNLTCMWHADGIPSVFRIGPFGFAKTLTASETVHGKEGIDSYVVLSQKTCVRECHGPSTIRLLLPATTTTTTTTIRSRSHHGRHGVRLPARLRVSVRPPGATSDVRPGSFRTNVVIFLSVRIWTRRVPLIFVVFDSITQ